MLGVVLALPGQAEIGQGWLKDLVYLVCLVLAIAGRKKTHSRLSEDRHTNKDQPEYDDSPTVLRAFETNRELSLQPSPRAGLCRFNEQLLMLFHARMSVMC